MKERYLVRAAWKARTRISPFTRALCSGPSASLASDVVLKNVTRSNFESALAELRRYVKEADFVSIDLEMTGLTSAPWRECFEFDRQDIQYLKVKDSAEKFAVVQFGVCPFRWDTHTGSFVAYPHNFYIFPREESPAEGSSLEFLCQTSSLEFLAKYQFNFNLCIYDGISYLSRSREEEALRRLDSVCKDEFSDPSPIPRAVADKQFTRMADILFSERMKNKISEWRAEILHNRTGGPKLKSSSNETMQKFRATFFQMRPALEVNGLTSRQLRLIKLVTVKNFKDLAYVHVTDETSGSQHLIVYTDSTIDRDFLMREVKACHRKETEMKIKAAVGFRHVTDLLSSEGKLIVGHNCFLDIAHIFQKFVGPLPSSAAEFVVAVQTYFPHLVDTKVLLNANDSLFAIMKKGSTSLSKAFTLLCPQIAYGVTTSSSVDKSRIKVEVRVDDQRFSNWNSGAKHEAGYDAFMTGCVFAQACCHLGIDFHNHVLPVDLLHNNELQKYINHLYLSSVNGDVIDLRTGKSDAESLGSNNLKRHQKILFSNMVLLWGLTSKLKAREIRDCLYKVFGTDSVVSIYHLDDTAILVQFRKAELVSQFLELKDTLERENNPIAVLHPMSRILDVGGCIHAACYEIYKEICSSPLAEVLFTDQAEAIGIKWKTRLMELRQENEIDLSSACQDQNADPKSNVIDSLSGHALQVMTWEIL